MIRSATFKPVMDCCSERSLLAIMIASPQLWSGLPSDGDYFVTLEAFQFVPIKESLVSAQRRIRPQCLDPYGGTVSPPIKPRSVLGRQSANADLMKAFCQNASVELRYQHAI